MTINVEQSRGDQMSAKNDEGQNSWPAQLERPCAAMEQAVRDKPVVATLAAFGIGVGLGAVVGCLMADRAFDRRQVASNLGQRILDSISQYVPETVQHPFGR